MFIAEIGINHNGDINIAKELIKKCKEAGADVVKFQKRNPDLCIPESRKNNIRKTPWGEMKYIDYKKRIEFGKKEYDEINKYCKEVGIKWTASVWDKDSLNFLVQYDIPFIKIPSACITNIKLISVVNNVGIPVVMSTGMSSLEEINRAVNILDSSDLTILHCNSSYPTPENEINLNRIKTLKKLFPGHIIGYSGHEEGIYPTICAAVIGAEVIERHVTLDKNMWGTDHSASLDMSDLNKLIKKINQVNYWLGSGDINITKSEISTKNRLRRSSV